MGRYLTFLLWAQLANLRPETTLLAEVREKMLDLLVNQPNYTCLETVERTRQAPGGGSQVEDTLRLEVALVDGKEMFAWPGAKQFEDRDIRELVSTGMFGNGNYGIYPKMLFSGTGPEFVYQGRVPLFGLQLARYDFRVHVLRSGYHVSVGDVEAVTGFHGSIYLDPEKADLRRLEIIADDIPAELGLTASQDRVDYAQALIGDEEFLLPVASELRMVTKDSISRNRVRFSGCRKFAGESSLIFDDPEWIDVTEAPAVTEVTLPRHAALNLELRSELPLDKAAVGDPVIAILRSDIKEGKRVIVPKGATAKGRVIMLSRSSFYSLVIQFQELEWKGGHATVEARLEGLGGIALATKPRIGVTPDGVMEIFQPIPRNLKNQLLLYRTVR